MNKTIKTETIVGFFVLIALIVFVFLTFQLGLFRGHGRGHIPYTLCFKDISGLKKKDEVKIAGVSVGWVHDITLQDDGSVCIVAMIARPYSLHDDAYGLVRQEGFLGGKFLEIVPGDPRRPKINAHTCLMQGHQPVAVEELLLEFKSIARHITTAFESFNALLSKEHESNTFQQTLTTLHATINSLAHMTKALEHIVERNQSSCDSVLHDMAEVTHTLKEQLPALLDEIKNLTSVWGHNLTPVVTQGIEKTTAVLEGVQHRVEEVTDELTRGSGIVPRLLHDKDTADNVSCIIQGVKSVAAKIKELKIILDPHVEGMLRKTPDVRVHDLLGYFDVRIAPRPDYFYLVGLINRHAGTFDRKIVNHTWFDCTNEPLSTENLSDADALRFAPQEGKITQHFNRWLFNLQFGKIIKNLTFRIGFFESTVGVGLDYTFALHKWFTWITSFEIFDMRGTLHLHERIPHLKWVNRVFFSPHFYVMAGIDDFICPGNRSAFVGAGLRFDTLW